MLFPAGRRLCGQLLTDGHCLSSFATTLPGSCDCCGKPATFNAEFPQAISYCRDCQEQRFAFHLARSYGLDEGTLARAIPLLSRNASNLWALVCRRLAEVFVKSRTA
jgi:predicted amidophosphoribosyltransferase